MDIILASGSPRRKELLTQIGVKDYRVVVSDVDENVDRDMLPDQMVEELSRRKALAVRDTVGDDALIIAADTVVSLEGEVLGKPSDETDAFRMLSALSGNRHQVYTGFTVLRGGEAVTSHEMTNVTFRELEAQEIMDYIATDEPMDKAGAYGIQGLGAVLISGIEGDYFNVMGLPVYRLGRVLAGFGVDTLALAAGRKPGKDS